MSETVATQATVDHPSTQLPVNDLAVLMGYGGTYVVTLTVVYQGVTYIQTITRDGSGNATAISQWVPQ